MEKRFSVAQETRWLGMRETAQALLDAPHLKPSEQLCLFANRGLSKAMKTALKKKFGKALRLGKAFRL